MNIVFIDAFTTNREGLSWNELNKFENFMHYDRTPGNLTVERCKHAEIIIKNEASLTNERLNQLSKLNFKG